METETDKLLGGRSQQDHGSTNVHMRPGIQDDVNRELLQSVSVSINSEGGEVVDSSGDHTKSELDQFAKDVLAPYMLLLKLVAWKSWFDIKQKANETVFSTASHDTGNRERAVKHVTVKKIFDITYVVWFVCVLLVGYIIQIDACFRRDSFPPMPNVQNNTMELICSDTFLSRFVIPDILHLVSYIWSMVLLRKLQSGRLRILMDGVFLRSEPCDDSYPSTTSRRKMANHIKMFIYLNIGLVIISLAAQLLHVVPEYKNISFTWIKPAHCDNGKDMCAGKAILLIIMLSSFVALDIVYVTLVINFSIQCALLMLWVEALKDQIKRRLVNFRQSAREAREIDYHLQQLNMGTSQPLSLVVFNFAAMAILGTQVLFTPHDWNGDNPNLMRAMAMASTMLSVSFWYILILIPAIQAARLTGKLQKLRKIGHELQVKEDNYIDVDDSELDRYLMFYSSLDLKARMFFIPMRASYIGGIILMGTFIGLLLFQMQIVWVWLGPKNGTLMTGIIPQNNLIPPSRYYY